MMNITKRNLIKITALTFLVLLDSFSYSALAQTNNSTNEIHPYKNWEISFGLEGMTFYANEDNSGLNKNPFNLARANLGPTATVGKWFTPEIGLRLKASGYWGKALTSIDRHITAIRYYNIQFQPQANFFNIIKGYDPKRFYNLIPHVGVGFERNCTYNLNYFLFNAGVNNTFRISDHIKAHFDIGIDFSSKNKNHKYYSSYEKPNDPNWWDENKEPIEILGLKQFRRIYFDAGLTFVLGPLKDKKKNIDPHYIYNIGGAKDYSKIFYTNYEDKRFARILPKNKIPYGMVLVNRGHIKMGITNSGEWYNNPTPVRDVSVDDFWMDVTEVTNRQYRAFVDDIVQDIIKQRLSDPFFNGDSIAVVNSIYATNPVTGERYLDGKQLNYVYEEYDYLSASKKEFRLDQPDADKIIIAKDTAYVNNEGKIVRRRITRRRTGPYDFLNTYVVNILPDTTVWINDFPMSDNSMYAKYYFSHPDYSDYPVVGVTWEQAQAYCAWRTEKLKEKLGGDLGDEQPFRLPTEAEWEYAARGISQNEFPWQQEITGSGKQTLLANFQNEEGNYTKDGNIITSIVGTYRPNTYGLYDMAGNVAEWTSTAFTETGVEDMNNINPQHTYNAADTDPLKYTRKTVRGGSWKDPESHIKSAWRTSEFQNQPRSYIGFRCVRSIATKPTEKAVLLK